VKQAVGVSKTASTVTRSHFVIDQDGKLLEVAVSVKPVDE
jgi:peroxiredoxin